MFRKPLKCPRTVRFGFIHSGKWEGRKRDPRGEVHLRQKEGRGEGLKGWAAWRRRGGRLGGGGPQRGQREPDGEMTNSMEEKRRNKV